jgi:hypothetical protein
LLGVLQVAIYRTFRDDLIQASIHFAEDWLEVHVGRGFLVTDLGWIVFERCFFGTDNLNFCVGEAIVR